MEQPLHIQLPEIEKTEPEPEPEEEKEVKVEPIQFIATEQRDGSTRYTPAIKLHKKDMILAEIQKQRDNGVEVTFTTVFRTLSGKPEDGKIPPATFKRWWGVLRDEGKI